MSQKRSREAAIAAARTDAVSSCPRPGAESRTRRDAPAGAGAPSGGRASGGISNGAPPARSQPSRKTTAISHATGPSRRAWVSRQIVPGGGVPIDEPYSSPMFMPPVNATRRSTARIFRWSR